MSLTSICKPILHSRSQIDIECKIELQVPISNVVIKKNKTKKY